MGRPACAFLTLSLFLTINPALAYTVKKIPVKESFVKSLDRGWIYTTSDYDSGTSIQAKMQVVIEAPPEQVWELYTQNNNWKLYKIPTLVDSRALNESFVNELKNSKVKKVRRFYSLLADRFHDPYATRHRGGKWESFAFQYYDLPWPVDNKWLVLKQIHDESKTSSSVFASESFGVGGNIKSFYSSAVFKPFENNPNRTLMDYKVTVDTGYPVPKFLLAWGTEQTLPRVMKAIRRYLKTTPSPPERF